MNSSDLLAYLDKLQERYHAHLKPLPQQAFKKEPWLGVGFMLSGNHFAAPLQEVVEIVNTPKVTTVPGVPAWLRGVMNLRGYLVPIYDLQGFLNEESIVDATKFQVLVISHLDSKSGVLIEKVSGVLRFSDQDWREKPADEDTLVSPYVVGFYEHKEELWRIFSMKKFVDACGKMKIGADVHG